MDLVRSRQLKGFDNLKFSIITACSRRDSRRLMELKSNLEAQTRHNFEWVVACNDPQLKLSATSFVTRRVKFYPHTLGAARNAAIRASHGQFLIFLDADDYLTLNTIEDLDLILNQSGLMNQDRWVVDLNCYYTYEPKNIFVNSIRTNRSYEDALPQTDKRINNFHPISRNFNYSSKLLKWVDCNSKYRHWLNHQYWLYTGNNLYSSLGTSLMVSGKVIPREMILKHGWSFDPSNALYSGLSWMAAVLMNTDQILKLADYHYIMVEHNDPINYPSLSQRNSPHRWETWFKACLLAIKILRQNGLAKLAFSRYTMAYIHRYFYKAVAMDLHSVGSIKTCFNWLQRYLLQLDARAFTSVNYLSRGILINVRDGHFELARRKMSVLVASRDVRNFIHDDNQTAIYESYRLLFDHLPVNPKVIIYESFIGRSYADNPKYIYLYIQKHYPHGFIHVWIADDANYSKIKHELSGQPDTIVVRKFGFEYMYYLAVSKYQIFNMRQPRWFVKRPGTYFIETWHGTPLKRLVFDLANIANAPLYKKGFYYQTKQWDHLLTDNQYSYNIFGHAFMYPKFKMLKTGYPRNDILNAPNRNQLAKQIKIKLGIPLNKKVILYAPTWRDDQYLGAGQYNFQLKLNLSKMQHVLGKRYVLILRTHYFVTNNLDLSNYKGFVYNESGYDDISELYLISDLLITDYSSVFFDYAILKRPILYFTYDYDRYSGVLRGFYLNMKKDLPGPLLKTSDQVLWSILHINQVEKKYHQRYLRFNRRFNAWDDGNAAKRVADVILKHR